MRNILFLILIVTFYSCGTRKRVMHKKEKQISSIQQNDIVKTTTTDIKTDFFVIESQEEIILTPINKELPYTVNGKTYQNVTIHKKTSKKIDSTKTVDKSILQESDKSKTETTYTEKSKEVKVDRDNSFGFFDWFWMLLAIVLVLVVVFRWKNIYRYILSVFTG